VERVWEGPGEEPSLLWRYAARACGRGGGAEQRKGWGLYQPLPFSWQPGRRLPSPGRGTL
jgi:hypothetical protein